MILQFLYRTFVGNLLLKLLTARPVSKAAGALLDSRFSRFIIKPFAKVSHIDLSEAADKNWPSFNAFFTRGLKNGSRWIDENPGHLCSPCDGRLSVYPIDTLSSFTVKGIRYTVASLLRDRRLALRYRGGTCLVFRLTPADYHRCHYPDSGTQLGTRKIRGIYHTVQPEALTNRHVFRENAREYSLLRTDNFGNIIYMEVGAMLVGRISQVHGAGTFARGEEKSRFEYGGSTVILLLEKDRIKLRSDLLRAMSRDREVFVQMGDPVGSKV